MLTEINRASHGVFHEDMITIQLKISGAHTDGITSIELIEENEAFITSSFDCCCHIWSIKTGSKIGSLLLGGDPNWRLVFDMNQRKEESLR
jgi:WD40 repeat protein